MSGPEAGRVDGSRGCEASAGALIASLGELADALGVIDPDGYTAPAGEVFAGASIGGHVRHTLDHVRALLAGIVTGVVNYDRRERGTAVELNLAAAAAEIDALRGALRQLSASDARRPVEVMCLTHAGSSPVGYASTLGRELAFVLSHTIHHNAMVRSIVVGLGKGAPRSLGLAPSTQSYRRQIECAR